MSRIPFDLPEAERELVAGYHTEYGGMRFAMYYNAEYVALIAVSAMASTLFFGGYEGPWLPGPLVDADQDDLFSDRDVDAGDAAADPLRQVHALGGGCCSRSAS